MARKVFSCYFDRDVMRVMQVRNSWVVRLGDPATPFYDEADFEDGQGADAGDHQIARHYRAAS